MEAAWHERFACLRRHLEWFDQSDELLSEIRAVPAAAHYLDSTKPEFRGRRSPYGQRMAPSWREPPYRHQDRDRDCPLRHLPNVRQ
jgi:hypothetical protein